MFVLWGFPPYRDWPEGKRIKYTGGNVGHCRSVLRQLKAEGWTDFSIYRESE